MAKTNKRPTQPFSIPANQARAVAPRPVAKTATVATGRTALGAAGYAREPKLELFLLAMTNFVGEDTFHEAAANRDQRYKDLIELNMQDDPTWVSGLLVWLRNSANLRTAAIHGAGIGAAWARGGSAPGWARKTIDAVCQRADEPAEFVAWWLANHGRTFPGGVRRGLKDAVERLYTEFAYGKYDSDRAAVRWGDVIDLITPKPSGPAQARLFEVAMAERHKRAEVNYEGLPMVQARQAISRMGRDEVRALMADPGREDTLRLAGMTWEALTGNYGPLDAAFWEAMIPHMGVMALTRNLRNFDKAGIDGNARQRVVDQLTNPEAVLRSRMLPMRFYSAYKAVNPQFSIGESWNYRPTRHVDGPWDEALHTAMDHTLASMPPLRGRTLVLVDTSGSMSAGFSRNGTITRWEAAAVFGAALALRAENADLYEWGSGSRRIEFRKGDSVLTTAGKLGSQGGTDLARAISATYRRGYHDRVVILTDEQSHSTWAGGIDQGTNVHVWNLAGYRFGAVPGLPRYYVWGGLSDQCFTLMQHVEAGGDAAWPWEAPAA